MFERVEPITGLEAPEQGFERLILERSKLPKGCAVDMRRAKHLVQPLFERGHINALPKVKKQKPGVTFFRITPAGEAALEGML